MRGLAQLPVFEDEKVKQERGHEREGQRKQLTRSK